MNTSSFYRYLVGGLACLAALLCFTSVYAATENKLSEPEEREALEVNVDDMLQPWKGDLPGMLDRRTIRVLTTFSKTFFFINKGTQRGATHDIFMEFERSLNQSLTKEKKLKHRHLKVRIIFVPVARDQLISALNAGKGDIIAANLTITPARQQEMAFTAPIYSHVQELLLSGPGSPKVENLQQLSGKTVFVRTSSSYYESLVALNARFAQQSLPPITIEPAPEALEDEDLIEMLNAGLIPLTVVDRHKALFWKQVFPNIQVHQNIILRKEGNIGWAVRNNSPQLLALLNEFINKNRQGSKLGNTILLRYLKDARYVKNAAAQKERRKFLTMVRSSANMAIATRLTGWLMAAQGYQESRLNQSVRSHVGAIGVMR